MMIWVRIAMSHHCNSFNVLTEVENKEVVRDPGVCQEQGNARTSWRENPFNRQFIFEVQIGPYVINRELL